MTKDEALKKVLDIAERYLLDEDFLPIKEALEQPVQEPTCWITAHGEGFRNPQS